MARPRKKKDLHVVKFVPVSKVFKPMVEIRLLVDISGWVDREKKIKWSMAADTKEMIDEDKAREFVAKGYAEFVQKPKQPISQDEQDEHLATVTRLTPGETNG